MFYVALIVLLLCLLITLYFHHKYICNEIEELKELIKNIKLSDSNIPITTELLHSNNEPKKDTIKPIDELNESNDKSINQSIKPNYSKFINVPIIEHKEDINTDNITNNSSDESIKSIDKSLNNQSLNDQLQDNQELNDKVNNDFIGNKANDQAINKVINESDKQLPSLIESEDDLVIPEVIKNSFEYPSLNDLEQQVLNQITNEINNGISIINESLGFDEIKKHPRVEEVSDEEPINKKDNNDENKNEIINYEINENIINDVLNDIKNQEINNQNDSVKEDLKDNVNNSIKETIKDDIKETNDNISTNDNITKESLKDPEVKISNESIKPKINPEVINDLLNGNYKYLQLVKKCKDLGIDVTKKKKDEIFKILKSYL